MDGPVSPARSSLTSAEALIVEPSLPDAMFWSTVLASAGFHLTLATNFQEAKARLAMLAPALLLTQLRLQDYNGLHLVLRAKATRRETCTIVVSDAPDLVLQREAEGLGAIFISKPITRDDLLAVVFRGLFCRSMEPMRPPYERRALTRRQRVASAPDAERRVAADRRHDPFALVRAAPRFDLN